MRAYVDPGLCIGCGLCVSLVPDVFAVNDTGLAEAVADTGADNRAAVKEAVESCPVSAITENR